MPQLFPLDWVLLEVEFSYLCKLANRIKSTNLVALKIKLNDLRCGAALKVLVAIEVVYHGDISLCQRYFGLAWPVWRRDQRLVVDDCLREELEAVLRILLFAFLSGF